MKKPNYKRDRILDDTTKTIMQIFNTIKSYVHMKRALYITSTIMLIASSCTSKNLRTTHDSNIQDNATLIIMAYPEEVVRTTESFYSNLLPYIGMGIEGYVRGGHACMILIKDSCDTFEYFDLGRYISPDGYARARGADTDPETAVDVKAKWEGGKIANIKELLRWLYDHPEKTRGYGDLYASISESVNYESVKEYIKSMQDVGIVKYGPFDRDGSNCARFVTDAMLNGILDEDIQKEVNKLYMLTPAVLDNLAAANSYDYYYIATRDSVYRSSEDLNSIQIDMLLDGGEGYGHVVNTHIGALKPPVDTKAGGDWQWLGGIGYGAWYDIENTSNSSIYKISQYCVKGKLMFSALFQTDEEINLNEAYQFDYPSHYKDITLKVGGEKIELSRVELISQVDCGSCKTEA